MYTTPALIGEYPSHTQVSFLDIYSLTFFVHNNFKKTL